MSLYTDTTNYKRYMSTITANTNVNIETSNVEVIPTLAEKLKSEKIKIYHYHLNSTKYKRHIKHMTLATKVIDNTKVIFGVTFCSAKDKFNKQIGTELAYKDLCDWPKFIMVNDLKAKKILRKIFGYLASINNIKDAEYIIIYNLAKYLYNV
jgi:hypothetical protein